MRKIICSLLAAGLLGAGTGAAGDTDGKSLAAGLVSRAPEKTTQIYGYFTLRLADNRRREVPVKFITEPMGESWRSHWETQSAEDIPAERLTVDHHPGAAAKFEWSRLDRPDGTFQPLSATNLFQPFAKSDFFLIDLGLDFFQWPAQKILRTEMRNSRSCRVLESTNPSPAPGCYSRVVSWIDIESGQPVRAEVFDQDGKLLKVFAILGVKKENGRVRLKDLEIRNEQTDTRTRLNFELEIDR